MPDFSARERTDSTNDTFSYSMRNVKHSPRAAAEAMVHLPFGETLNEGVFSVWNGQRPR